MSVELSATAVNWSTLLSKLEEKPTRLRRAKFFFDAMSEDEPWLEDLSGPLDPSDSTMVYSAEAYDRVRDLLEPGARERFDRFAGAFFWIATNLSPYKEPPVRDLGPKSDREIFFSSFSPDSVASYLATWKSLDLESLRGPFEQMKAHLAFYDWRDQTVSLFEGWFRPYVAQWGGVLEAASARGWGLIISFL